MVSRVVFAAVLFALRGCCSAVSRRDTENVDAFSALVVFGDSFSDNGNGSFHITNGTWPPQPAYVGGRFSNGLVWPEYVAANLTVPLYDYAVGGATTSDDLVKGFTGPHCDIPAPFLLDQIGSFLNGTSPTGTLLPSSSSNNSNNNAADFSSPLFVIFSGANDVIFNPNITAYQSYQVLADARDLLREAYLASPSPSPETTTSAAILTIAPPDLSKLPIGFYTPDPTAKDQLRLFSKSLAGLIAAGQLGKESGDFVLDLGPLFDDFEYYASPASYGFAALGKYGSCVVGTYKENQPTSNTTTVCGEPMDWVYWDAYQ